MHELSEPVLVVLERVLDAKRKGRTLRAGGRERVGPHRSEPHRRTTRSGLSPKDRHRSFALDRALDVRIEPRIKQVTVGSAGRSIAVFIRREQLSKVEALVAELRRRIYPA
jgi:hypothetical protein